MAMKRKMSFSCALGAAAAALMLAATATTRGDYIDSGIGAMVEDPSETSDLSAAVDTRDLLPPITELVVLLDRRLNAFDRFELKEPDYELDLRWHKPLPFSPHLGTGFGRAPSSASLSAKLANLLKLLGHGRILDDLPAAGWHVPDDLADGLLQYGDLDEIAALGWIMPEPGLPSVPGVPFGGPAAPGWPETPIEPSNIPAPGALALLALGLGSMRAGRRRR